MSEPTVNVPLLRKAVEWAEAEAAKPWEVSEWNQQWWISPPELVASEVSGQIMTKAPECGTCYCIAGYVSAEVHGVHDSFKARNVAMDALGLDEDEADLLFDGSNSIETVRSVAESIAGERL